MAVVKRTLELDQETNALLEKLAAASGRASSDIVAEAIASYAAEDAETAEDDRRWAEYLRTGEAYEQAEVEAWLRTAGTPAYRPFDEFRRGLKRS
jgi:predicted transcriptional regulator